MSNITVNYRRLYHYATLNNIDSAGLCLTNYKWTFISENRNFELVSDLENKIIRCEQIDRPEEVNNRFVIITKKIECLIRY